MSNKLGIIHAGAHVGTEHPKYVKFGFKRFAYFEPVFDNFKRLRDNVAALPGVQCFHTALGSRIADRLMHIETANNGESCSLLKPKEHLRQLPWIEFTHTEQVQEITLDSLEVSGFQFMVIDVQGYELEVLKGAEQTIVGMEAIACEINREELYEGCALAADLTRWLTDRQWSLAGVDWFGGSFGNAVFVRDKRDQTQLKFSRMILGGAKVL